MADPLPRWNIVLSRFYTTLDNEALLHIAGPDTETFLQGQVTCDMREVDDTHCRLGAYCNPQGRMHCDFLALHIAPEHIALRLRADTLPHASATLGKYIVFSKANIQAPDPAWAGIGLWGDDVERLIEDQFCSAPSALESVAAEGAIVARLPAEAPLFECWFADAEDARLAALIAAAEQNALSRWEGEQVAAGLGRVEAGTIETFIPQMLNFDLTGHVNFTKGCYTGQEVVARMHYRGKPKRRLYRAAIDGSEAPAAGIELFSSSASSSVGNVVNSGVTTDGGLELLVVATADGAQAGLHLGAADSAALTLLPMPNSPQDDE